jgi:hypothetical protein
MITMRRSLLASAVVVVAAAGVSALGSLGGGQSASAAPTTPAPDVTTGAATGVTQHQARLTGTVNPHGSATSYTFQFGPSASYGAETAHQSAGAGTTAASVSATLSGLETGTTYHYRLVATNAQGQKTSGVDRTLTTQGPGASKLGLFGHTAFVSPSRIVGVFTGCFGAHTCTGSMKWTANGVLIGQRSSFTIGSDGGGIVHVTMNSAGRTRLAHARRGHLRTRVTVTSPDAGTDTKIVTVVPFR